MSSSASTPQYEEQVVGSLESLVNRLNRELIEWPDGRNSYFLPIDVIGTIKDQGLLHEVLKELFPHMDGPKLTNYADSIYHDATKIFGFLLCRSSWKDCGRVIIELIDEGISDKDLPFSRVHVQSTNAGFSNSQSMASPAYTLGRSSCPCEHHRKCGIKAFSRWKRMELENLCRDQWITLAPVFENLAHYNFEDNVILPFIHDLERIPGEIKKGGYSEVWATRIHPAHQTILQSTHPLGPLVAIKRLFSREEKDFEQERNMLVSLTRKDHRHLVKLVTTYKFNGHYHLLCPMAKANLRDYWKMTPLRQKDKSYLWALTNIAGITSGLNLIHNFKTLYPAEPDETNSAISRSRPSWKIRMTLAPNEEFFGRHGDLKPENILWVTDTEGINDAGVLQISDFGLSRFHRLESKSKADPRNINGSPTYVPPELPLERPISREYDIWSLGCIFLEFLTWLLEGQDGLDDFSEARKAEAHDGIVDDTYYILYDAESGLEGKVREGVTKWIERLRQDHCCSEMIMDLLQIVQNRMLIAKPKDRVKADELEGLVQNMLNRGNNSPFYLLGH